MTQRALPRDEPRKPIEARLVAAGLPPLPRLSWLEIDLSTLAANASVLRGLLPSGCALGVVVKADGYGHGMVAAARAAVAGGARLLAVATLDEALVLRGAGVQERILVLYPVPETVLALAADADLELVASDASSVADRRASPASQGCRAARPSRHRQRDEPWRPPA